MLRAADLRIATVFHRLVTANAPLCDRRWGAAGLVLHSLALYDRQSRELAAGYFSLAGPVGIEGLVPGGPSAAAGIVQDEALLAVDGRNLGTDPLDREQLNQLQRSIGEAGADGAIELGIRRNGAIHPVRVATVPSCAAMVELRLSSKVAAGTDGEIVQIDAGLYEMLDDDESLAAVIAHELAHIVLNHPERLEQAGVSRGLFKGFGRSGRLWRVTEDEADALSVYLLANAGFDPFAVQRMWEKHGRRIIPLFAGGTHAGWRTRAKRAGVEAAKLRRSGGEPQAPAWFASRSQPLG